MNKIDVLNSIKIYEIDGTETKISDDKKLQVSSHWNRREFVEITIPGGQTFTVAASDLQKAIKNATNS